MAERQAKKPIVVYATACLLVAGILGVSIVLRNSGPSEQEGFVALQGLYETGDYEAVVEQGNRFVEDYPESSLGWSQLGWAYLKLDAEELAQQCFERSIELNPDWDNAYVRLGVLLRKQGDFAGARDNYQKAIALVPDNPEAFSSLLTIELMENNDAKAVEYGERAWALKPSDPVIAANLAIAYHCAGNIEKRDALYEEARKLGYNGMETLDSVFSGEIGIR